MKAFFNNELVKEILPWERKVLENDLLSETLEDDMKRRLKWIWEHKIEQCFRRLEAHWVPILRKDPAITSIPTSPEEFVNLIVSRPDYINRSQHDKEFQESLKKNKG